MNKQGFTLIELLIIIAIIGILATTAISSFKGYRNRGFTAQVVSDVKNAITAEESVYVNTNSYTNVVVDLINEGYNPHPDVTLTITTSINGFVITATHAKCGTSAWTFDSLVDSNITGGPCVP